MLLYFFYHSILEDTAAGNVTEFKGYENITILSRLPFVESSTGKENTAIKI